MPNNKRTIVDGQEYVPLEVVKAQQSPDNHNDILIKAQSPPRKDLIHIVMSVESVDQLGVVVGLEAAHEKKH